MRTSRRQQVHDYFRDRIEKTGTSPTYRQAGEDLCMTAPGVWKHVDELVDEGALIRSGRRIDIPQRIDLTLASTDALRGELARRGVTFDALAKPKVLEGNRFCAAYHCTEQVEPGQLMCREHWFELNADMRSAIMNAWRARHVQAYQDAVEAARDHLGGFTRVVERVA